MSRRLHPSRKLELRSAAWAARTIEGVAKVFPCQPAEDASCDGAKASSRRSKEESSFGAKECPSACTADTAGSLAAVFSEVDKTHTAGRAVNVNFIRHG